MSYLRSGFLKEIDRALRRNAPWWTEGCNKLPFSCLTPSLGQTAQTEPGGGNGIVMTIEPEGGEKFPSIRLLLFGDPLFEVLTFEGIMLRRC